MRGIRILAGAALLGAAGLAQAQKALPVPVVAVERPAAAPVATAPELALRPCLSAEALRGARIAALGVYESDRGTSITLGGADQATGIVTVGADRAGPPLVLVLTAINPVIWDLRAVPASRLRGVITYGGRAPGLVGVPDGVPVRFASPNGEMSGCGRVEPAWEGGRRLDAFVKHVFEVTGRRIDSFRGAYYSRGFHLDGGAVPGPGTDFGPEEVRSPVWVGRDRVAPREEGIAQLLSEGAIRRATSADIDALAAAMTRASATGDLAEVRPNALPPNVFVVLRAIEVPKGMYGGRSAVFLIAAGVPDPVDASSHNTYYSLETGSCHGSACYL